MGISTEPLVFNKSEPIPWRGAYTLEKIGLVVLPLLAVAAIAVNFLDAAALRTLSRWPVAGPVLSWLAGGKNSFFVFFGALAVLIIFALLIRLRLNRNKRLWFGTGCPDCKEQDLVRVKRHFNDRLYGLIGVPAYRYACRNCTWRGLRIARKEYSLAYELERERNLLRFQPDTLSYLEEVELGLAIEPDSLVIETSPDLPGHGISDIDE